MSGVGISGLLANLPNTVTPYPTQDPALELGGYRSVSNAAARDAIPANFRAIGMQVTLQDTGVTYQLVGGILNANWQAGGGAPQPFKGNFWVNPTFAGVQTGSQSNPFTTVAAAFAFAASLALTGGLINIPMRTSITENIVFPDGGRWEIRGVSSSPFGTSSTLTGTVNVSSNAAGMRILTNLFVFGAVSGVVNNVSPNDSFFQTTNCLFFAGVTLTAASTAKWTAIFVGPAQKGQNSWGGAVSGNTSIAGEISAINWAFLGNLDLAFQSYFDGCDFGANTDVTITANTTSTLLLSFFGCCDWHSVPAFTVVGGGALTINADSLAMSRLMRRGTTPTGTIAIASLNSHVVASNAAATNNLGPGAIQSGVVNTPLMVAEAALTLLTPGTLGSAVVNVIYTDYTGVLRTKAVTTALNVAGAAGDSVSGVFPFSQNGATAVAYSVTGIVTPGALVFRLDFSLRAAS